MGADGSSARLRRTPNTWRCSELVMFCAVAGGCARDVFSVRCEDNAACPSGTWCTAGECEACDTADCAGSVELSLASSPAFLPPCGVAMTTLTATARGKAKLTTFSASAPNGIVVTL